jgi:hypothetical protein
MVARLTFLRLGRHLSPCGKLGAVDLSLSLTTRPLLLRAEAQRPPTGSRPAQALVRSLSAPLDLVGRLRRAVCARLKPM